MKSMIRWAGVAGLCCISTLVAAQELRLWPSELCDIRAHSDTTAEKRFDGAVVIKTGTGYNWPGVTLFFKAGEMDLAAYGEVHISVSNTTAKVLSVHLSVKNKGHKDGTPGGKTTLAPGATGVIKAKLRKTPWVLDNPLELVGMNGYPSSLEGGAFNVRKAAELHIFMDKPTDPASFALIGASVFKTPLALLPADGFLPFVDEFGQFRHVDWPGKIHSEEQLRQAVQDEAAWLKESGEGPLAERNQWGGWLKGPQLRATGHFRTEKVNDKWWLVDPDGRLFFSHGVDCVRAEAATGIEHREKYFAWLPEKESPYADFYGKGYWAPHGFYKDHCPFRTYDFARANMLRKYGSQWQEVFAAMAHQRIRAWGLNTIANWSDSNVYLKRRTAYTVCLNTSGPRIEGSSGWWGKFPDPYAPDFIEHIRKKALAERTQGTAADPWCIGYFVDNELSWGGKDMDLALAAVLSPATQPVKVAFKEWLAKRYVSVAALNTVWGSEYASWDALMTNQERPDVKRCEADLSAFNGLIAEQYFRTIREALREAAPDKLYLGCRIAWGAPSVYRASAKYCDVVSVNIYKHAAERELPEGSDDKPMINGEFHFGALDRGMFHTGLVATENQRERAAAYVAFVESCLKHPRFIGTHWFQWQDQALTGRGDGENYQIGFLTVTDQPYPELVEAARKIGATMYQTRFGTP